MPTETCPLSSPSLTAALAAIPPKNIPTSEQTNMDFATTFFESNIRQEEMIWLACQADQYTETLRDFFTDGDVSAASMSNLFGVSFTDDELESASAARRSSDAIGDFMRRLYKAGKMGFLVKVGTPIPTSFHPSGYSTSGFGYYTTAWFYTDKLDRKFTNRLIAWQEEFIAKKRADSDAEKAAGSDAKSSISL